MRQTDISLVLLGETYRLSGDPSIIRKAAELFQEILKKIQDDNKDKDISTHRLGAMTAIGLAERLIIFQDRQEKVKGLINLMQIQVRGLIEILEKSVEIEPDV